MRNAAIILVLGLGTGASAGNLLGNAGFESGTIAPWVSSEWQVVSDTAHSGIYSARVVGNYAIYQAFAPTPVGLITEVSVWLKQDPADISYLAIRYSDSTEDYELVHPTNTEFNKYDLTGVLNPSKTAVGFIAYGYSGGANGPTWIDDVNVQAVPEPTSVGALALGGFLLARRRRS
jgi:hypothetical protein